jgi:hypothetical protein
MGMHRRLWDRIFFTDWRGDADELLADGGPTIGDLPAHATGRGVEVRALLWRSPTPGSWSGSFVQSLSSTRARYTRSSS